jgi:two-component system, NarL family, sensor kinase
MDAKEKDFYITVLIIAGVVAAIILLFVISILRQHRRRLALYKKSAQTEIDTLERERARMAADLHDEVGPVLSALKLRLNSLELKDPDDEEELEKTNDQIDRLMKRMREISFDLMPNSLMRKGIAVAVKEFIDYVGRSSSVSILFQADDLALTQTQSINLYRIIQEVIHNTLKHARATELKLELRKGNDGLVLTTTDNGIGFNYDGRRMEASGQGLRNLLNRTEMMGGKMFFESGKGKGTTYIFEVPYAIHQDHSSH